MIYTTSMLKERYRDYSNPLDKIKRDTDRGLLIRLNRGIYENDPNVNPYLVAPCILSPSYLSFDFALSYYGLIPERVYAITSASFNNRKNKTFTNALGRFEYSDIPIDAFPYGIDIIEEGEYGVKIATKEKAICDSLYKWPVCHSVKELKVLLFEDKRIDEDGFRTCNFEDMLQLASLYKRRNLKFLIKLIRKEYLKD